MRGGIFIGSQQVGSPLVMLIMVALSFFIYVFMIPAQYIRSEQNTYGTSITETEDGVEQGGVVGVLLVTATVGTVMFLAIIGYEHMAKKKAQKSSSVPETEESAEHHN
jgi:preprotein translocase subunit SecG